MARFSGDNGNDQLYGTGNADELLGRGGSDVLRGRGGNDVLAGGPGSDLIDGGSGWDTVRYAGQQRAMHVNLAQNLAFALDGSGRDSDALVSIEHAIGSAAGDQLLGNGLANRLEGRAGFDTLFGGLGNDRILGGADTDRVVWSSGMHCPARRATARTGSTAARARSISILSRS